MPNAILKYPCLVINEEFTSSDFRIIGEWAISARGVRSFEGVESARAWIFEEAEEEESLICEASDGVLFFSTLSSEGVASGGGVI